MSVLRFFIYPQHLFNIYYAYHLSCWTGSQEACAYASISQASLGIRVEYCWETSIHTWAMDQIVLEGSGLFVQPVKLCFVDLERAFDCVPHGVLWKVLWEYRVRGPLSSSALTVYATPQPHRC